MKRISLAIAMMALSACGAPESGTIRPHLAFSIPPETGLSAARDLAIDYLGNIFVFDYDDYVIHKFGPSGEALGTFGGPAGEAGGFQHLMAIRALGDSLLALDAGSLSVFDLSGGPLGHRPFSDTITCDLPRIRPDGRWVGEWIIDETAEKALTYRDDDGRERARVTAYELGEFFPGVEPGGFFFIKPTQARSYLYDFLPDGRLVWAASDALEVHLRDEGGDVPMWESSWTPLPLPPDHVQLLRDEQAGLGPPLFMNVPEEYQAIQHLLVDETGDIWLYLTTGERKGFLHLSPQGRELGFYGVEAEFDLLAARVTAAGDRLYFLTSGQDGTQIYTADRP